jgi:uncharacterized repeat protein (TIGR01451 family)
MHVRRASIVAALLAILALLALLGVTGGTAASESISLTLTGSPPAVTPGKLVAYKGQITNNGADALVNVVLVESIPGAGDLVFSSFSREARCSNLQGGGARCSLGTLPGHESVRFTTVFGVPASIHAASLVNSSTVSSGHDTAEASATTALLPTDTTLKVGGYLGFPGPSDHSIQTNPALSQTNPHASTVVVPVVGDGVGVDIREGSGTSDPDNPSAPPSLFQCPDSPHGCIGQWTFVGIPETEPAGHTPFTPGNPFEVLVLFSRFEQPEGFDASQFKLYKNGVRITDTCPFDEGSTVCVNSISRDQNGTIVGDVLETVNGYIGGGG